MSQHNPKGPFPPTTASLGGLPTVRLDVPICAVFLVLFLIGAVCHMTILQVNQRRGHKFHISGMMFGFCMARITTMVMRIVWATRPKNVSIAIAANVFVAAGVVLLFVINLLFAQRIVRSCHPRSGWHPAFHWAFIATYVLIVVSLVMLITTSIQSFFSLNKNTNRIDRAVVLYGQTFYAVISFLPIPLVIGGILIPRKTRLEKFGHGRFRMKVGVLLASAFLLCLGACYRAGTNYAGGTRPISHPASYQSKACFYIFNFTIEIIVILAYLVIRVDKSFYVPNHSKKAGDYSRGPDFYTRRKQGLVGKEGGETGLGSVISPEETVFDDMSPEEVADHDRKMSGVDEEKGIPLENITESTSSSTAKPVPAAGFPSRLPPTPLATPPNERLAFPGEVIPTPKA
jgi:hypothetical protein